MMTLLQPIIKYWRVARVYTLWFEGKVECMPGKHMAGLPPGQAVLKLVAMHRVACVHLRGTGWPRRQLVGQVSRTIFLAQL